MSNDNSFSTSAAPSRRVVVETVYQALAKGDLYTAVALIDPDVVFDEPSPLPYAGVHCGRDAFVASVLGTMFSAAEIKVSELRVTETEFGAIAVLAGTLVARSDEETLPVRMVEIFTVVDGIIRKIDVFMKDPAAVAAFFARATASSETAANARSHNA